MKWKEAKFGTAVAVMIGIGEVNLIISEYMLDSYNINILQLHLSIQHQYHRLLCTLSFSLVNYKYRQPIQY